MNKEYIENKRPSGRDVKQSLIAQDVFQNLAGLLHGAEESFSRKSGVHAENDPLCSELTERVGVCRDTMQGYGVKLCAPVAVYPRTRIVSTSGVHSRANTSSNRYRYRKHARTSKKGER